MRAATILFVEDEPLIALFVQSALEGCGHRVLCAEGCEEALSLCRQQAPDLVLLNFRQAGGPDGASFACILHRQFRLPVLLVTGARSQDLPPASCFDTGCRVLYKPFTPRQLEHCVGRALQEMK